jgi:hypothetical protein
MHFGRDYSWKRRSGQQASSSILQRFFLARSCCSFELSANPQVMWIKWCEFRVLTLNGPSLPRGALNPAETHSVGFFLFGLGKELSCHVCKADVLIAASYLCREKSRGLKQLTRMKRASCGKRCSVNKRALRRGKIHYRIWWDWSIKVLSRQINLRSRSLEAQD